MMAKNLLIYRNFLLKYSETFIRDQAESLNNFFPYYIGTRLLNDLQLPVDRCFTVNNGKSFGKFNELFSQTFYFQSPFLQKLKKINPVLIHAHFAQDAATALPLSRYLNIPMILTCHGYDVTVNDHHTEFSIIQKRYQLHKKKLISSIKLFIAVSEFIKLKMIEKGFPEERIIVHYTGVNLNRFSPNLDVSRRPIVLFVGRLVEKKGCEYLLRAMCQVQLLVPEVELVVIGDGKLRASLEAFAKNSLRNYTFLGKQSHENVKAWMQRAKIFCVPSITAHSGDAEGFGMVFVEAQASGLPVVSCLSGGIPEAVSNNKTGFLVPERDSEALAKHLILLLQNQDIWSIFSIQGQERVKNLFDLRNQTQELENIYSSQLKTT